MKKKNALALTLVAAGSGVAAMALSMASILPGWAYAAVLVLAFPLFVLGLGLYWMAREGEEDIPFLGY
ncbi:MAG: hypothetical protein WC502_00845 [Methanolinea sp.]|jgi:energy-converting hydrogenase A subunit I|nr:hypothetical protein [Methanolinea sp.]